MAEVRSRDEGASEVQSGVRPDYPPLAADALILLPVRNTVLFPGVVMPLAIERERSIAAVQAAVRDEKPLGVILQTDSAIDEPGPEHLFTVGTVAEVLRYVTGADGVHHVICRGVRRFRVIDYVPGYPFLVARIVEIGSSEILSPEIEARIHLLKERAREIIQLLPNVPTDVSTAIEGLESASALTDFIAGIIDMKPVEKQGLLETFDVKERLDKMLVILAQRIQVLRLSDEIGRQTEESLGSQQRQHILREQLLQIQSELGESDDKEDEITELREAIERAEMPKEVEEQAKKEVKRLARMPEAAAEYAMIRAYLDWLIDLPWSKVSPERIEISEARRILDEDHYGLEKVKRRILEYLAVRKLNPDGKSPILCFVGPPGVGKTSLGQSIARATGRKFARLSLGGVHDEAEIRGHRRTYIGAMPGNIIQTIRKAGTRNPILMLDEMDKVGAGFHGDPSAALLEVLDPEQNATFRDNYLGVAFDLSRVMFIGTANVLYNIPGPLRDRMEVIEIPGYIEDEKVQIAMRYLVKRQLEAGGLTPEQCDITEAAIRAIIRGYTREAGVRNLERELGAICRHVAMRVAEGGIERMRIDEADLPAILGPRRFESEIAMRTSVPGVATGRAWTPTGGDRRFVEATRVPGREKLILTGQLGDVMKESAQAAVTLLKARAADLGIDLGLFDRSDVHIHVPAGAIPKDGPSAGVAMFMALASLFTGKTVRSDTAMTGEISLRGLVLPIGGVKEKVLAAARAGIATVLLPERNRMDLEDVPEKARTLVRFVWLATVDDAIEAALTSHQEHSDAEGKDSAPAARATQ
ncbi:MAG: ATP-dependent Lon protease [Rhodospirillaceae bacterium]|nr:ATP-dependent Lon protease [Rhodospirillaceae bacterium]